MFPFPRCLVLYTCCSLVLYHQQALTKAVANRSCACERSYMHQCMCVGTGRSADCSLFLGAYVNAVLYGDKTASVCQFIPVRLMLHTGGFVAIQYGALYAPRNKWQLAA